MQNIILNANPKPASEDRPAKNALSIHRKPEQIYGLCKWANNLNSSGYRVNYDNCSYRVFGNFEFYVICDAHLPTTADSVLSCGWVGVAPVPFA